jgi:hypothetical protein
MNRESRLAKIAEKIGLGRLWDGTQPTGYLPDEDSVPASAGQARQWDSMAASSVMLHLLMEPAELRKLQRRAPTEEGRQGYDELIEEAESQAAEIREQLGVEDDASIDEVIAATLKQFHEQGHTPAELRCTRRQMEAAAKRFENNRQSVGA